MESEKGRTFLMVMNSQASFSKKLARPWSRGITPVIEGSVWHSSLKQTTKSISLEEGRGWVKEVTLIRSDLPLLGRPEAHEPNTSNLANGQMVVTQVLMDSISPSSAGRRFAWTAFQWCQYFKI
jgi:hypothetical protein